ncbi:MAG: hypothetical protein L3J66_02750 [Bacteroidales bacterium]|nr:hypothetical protein [Bacteroidales bacterium]
MKVFIRLAVLTAFFLTTSSSFAQFVSASKGRVKKEDNAIHPESNRQQDINLLEQKAKVMERDFLSGNASTFKAHKTDVLAIMDREISRSNFDLAELRNELPKVDGGPDSPKGRALRIEIMQMEGRSNKQQFIRTRVLEFTADKVQNTKELSGLKAHYFQFIESMKANLKYSDGNTPPSGEAAPEQGSPNSTSSGKASNDFVSSGMVSSTQNKQELPESYYRSKDLKFAKSYATTKNNTAAALSGTAKEIQAALGKNKSEEATRLLADVTERMQSDIAFDRKVTAQLERGELKYSGLNAGLLKNNIAKKAALLNKANSIRLPGQKSQLFSLISEYIQLLE